MEMREADEALSSDRLMDAHVCLASQPAAFGR